MTDASLEVLVALQNADSAFPSGGFAFSQGMEAASQLAGQLGPFDFEAFMRTQLLHRWATADCVAMVRSHRLAGDIERMMMLDHEVEASSPIEPLRTGSRRNGMALVTAHARIGSAEASDYRDRIRQKQAPGHLAVVQGMLWRAAGLGEAAAISVSGYQVAMSLATAAVRLGLVGSIEAQAVLRRALPLIARIAPDDIEDDTPLSSFVPLAEIAALSHRLSEQRLFSN